jgi:hypothetical protein
LPLVICRFCQHGQVKEDVVLKWISKAFGETSIDLSDGVPAPWAKQLELLLSSAEKLVKGGIRSGLARDMLSYVLHGDPLAVLNEVGQQPGMSEQLHLTGYHYRNHGEQTPELYRGFDAVPPAVGLRWARLLEACVPVSDRRYSLQFADGANWPETLLMHSTGCSISGWSSARPVVENLSAQTLENLLLEAGMETSALIASSFSSPVNSSYMAPQRLLLASDLVGYADALDRHAEAIRPLLLPALVPQRLHVLAMLEKAEPLTLDRLAPELCELAVSSSKQVRAAAETVVRRCGTAIVPPLRCTACDGKPDQRLHALRLLHAMAQTAKDDALTAFVHETAMADKAPSVTALIAEWSAAQTDAGSDAEQAYEYEMPHIDWSGALTPQLSALLEPMWREVNASIEQANRQAREHHQRMQAQGHKYPLHQTPIYSDQELKSLREYLASDQIKPPTRKNNRGANWQHMRPALQKLASGETMTPVALLKMLFFFDILADKDGLLHQACASFNAMHRASGRPTLLELAQMLEDSGHAGAALLHNYCSAWGDPLASDWASEAVWPFFAHHMERLIQTLTLGPVSDYRFNRAGLFRAIATLPTPPATIINALFGLALGSGKSDRPAAQEALANHPGKEARIINALADGKYETRAIAAQWLGRLRHAPAIPALEQAVLKEKHDVPKGAMLDALQLLGQPVEKYLDRKALATDAAKSLAKGVPKDLEWFPWSALPEVRWADTGEPVPADVLRWMMVQAVKQKSPEPNAVLRKYCVMFAPRDREQFGQMILETWLREDVRPIPAEDAMKHARNQAQSVHHSMAHHPQYFQNSPNFGRSVEELTAIFLPGFLRQPAGSATGSKGLLAVAAACAAERAAGPTARYLKEWYGSRAAQGKALIAMLAWIEHPSATQLMLSIGNRFRTKSFQEEATRQAEALADRKGWTLSELADRTIPSAGFDETGTLELPYGTRQFSARLLPDFKVELYNPEGKKITALPEPRQDDDEELAKDAKKAFSAAKKEIKNIVALQTDRLYEALCTERDWPFEDWQLYLNQHPVVRHLVQRLVWAQVDDGNVTSTFRPLDDGSLTDCDDNEVQLPTDARVRIAHDSLLSAEQIAAWQQHLVDYEITPLFQQMGKGIYVLPPEQASADSIKDFEGYLLEAFALRGRALKLGYTRGAAEDGGWFHVYEKRFPTLGLEAVIQFTGNPLPEENRTVALLNLSFSAAGGNTASWQRTGLPLSKVPKVLLSECYNDLRLIAAEGPGFDSDWQKKSEY